MYWFMLVIRQSSFKARISRSLLNEKDLYRKLENCMRNGFDVILEDVEETLPSHLDSLISKHYIYEGIHTSVSLADSLIYVHPNFHLFISPKLSNPHYLPETAIKVCIVNFTVNINSLQEHLLADVFRLEEPDIEAQNLDLSEFCFEACLILWS